MKQVKHYGINILTAVISFFLYGILQTFYFLPDLVQKKFRLDGRLQLAITIVLTIVFMWLIYWFYQRQLAKENNWHFNEKPHWYLKKFKYVAFGFILIIASQIILMNLLGGAGASPKNQTELMKFLKHGQYLFQIMVVLIGPILEEIIFRGFFFNTFCRTENKLNTWLGIIISGFIFGFCHDPQLDKFILVYWAMGIILAWVYLKTRDLRYSMLVHILNNAMSLL